MSNAERWVVLGLMAADLLVLWAAVAVSGRRAHRAGTAAVRRGLWLIPGQPPQQSGRQR